MSSKRRHRPSPPLQSLKHRGPDSTGFALYGEGLGAGSWADRLFGWVIPLMGQSQDVHTWHRLGMWGMVVFVTLHVYAAIREDIMGRQSIVSTMISGYRTFKD